MDLLAKAMGNFTESRLVELFDNFKNRKIAIVGDLMLDSYMWGAVRRISPEAPVPVVEVSAETVKLGGAANVANNIRNLGAIPIPIGVVGNDGFGEQIRLLFSDIGISSECVITDRERPTTIKTRIIAHDQHVVRADIESKEDLSPQVEDRLLELFTQRVKEFDGVILQDYNKGVITKRIITEIIDLCRKNNVFTAVDPKFNNFFNYRNVDLLKPNRRETEEALGIKIQDDEDLVNAAMTLFERLNCRQIMITLGSGGMSLFTGRGQERLHIPTRAAKIHDVSGAGDTVISTMVTALVAGASLEEGMIIANYAAGIVCGEVGVVPIEADRLKRELLSNSH